jgi:superfamily II DNA or RNA helicase
LVIAHTCINSPRKHYLMKKTVELGLDRWREMDWSLILKAIKGESTRPEPRSPYDYQEPAIVAAQKYFLGKKETRGRLIMPCGTGKSLISFWIAEKLKAKNVIVAVPSLGLIKQCVADWAREFHAKDQKPDWICVCSDDTVGNLKNDEALSEVYATGLPTYTNPKEIAEELRRSNGRMVVFTTYQSSDRLIAAARLAEFKFDLVIFDEAHRTAGPRYKQFATLLRDRTLDVRYRLFMTATERRINGDAEVYSMDDNEEDYGKRFFTMTYKQAIELGAIVDYKILTVAVSEACIAQLIATNRFLNLRRDLDEAEARQVATGLALKKAMRKFKIKKALSFHSSIKGADDFCKQQNALNCLRPQTINFHVSGEMTAGKRKAELDEFQKTSTPALMTNARCLTEGIDVPAIDCVVFADPKQSYVDIVQAAGRAMRTAKGKKLGYILLPLVVPKGMAFEDFAETTAFNEVARIITALSVADGRIVEELRAIGNGRVPKKRKRRRIIIIGGGDGVPVSLSMSLTKLADAISVRAWEKVARLNWRPFEEAWAFVRKLGLENQQDWVEYVASGKKPFDIPSNPNRVYAKWVNLADWLGSSRQVGKWRLFDEARQFARDLNLKNQNEWKAFAQSGKKPVDVPANPYEAYKTNGWISWGDWLGTGTVGGKRNYLSFEDARKFARGLKLKGMNDWIAYCRSGKKPANIPGSPQQYYSKWISWFDFLGAGRRHGGWLPFKDARKFARGLALRSRTEWLEFCKSGRKPDNIPIAPQEVYKNEWRGWFDWLGGGRYVDGWRPFKEARTYVHRLKLKGTAQWQAYCKSGKKPVDIPQDPRQAYKEFVNLDDWLGCKCRGRVWQPFPQARKFVHALELKTQEEWRDLCKSGNKPADIPAHPWGVYAEYKNTADWLGYAAAA